MTEYVTVKDKLEQKFQISAPVRLVKKFADAVNQRVINLMPIRTIPRAYSDLADTETAALIFYHYLLHELYKNCKELAVCDKPDFQDNARKKIRMVQLKHKICDGALLCYADLGYNAKIFRAFYIAEREDLEALAKAPPTAPLLNLTHKKVRTGDGDYDDGFVTSFSFEVVDASKEVKKARIVGKVKPRCDEEETVFACEVKIPSGPEEPDDLPEFVKVSDPAFEKGANGSPAPADFDIAAHALPAAEQRGPVLQDIPEIKVEHKVETEKKDAAALKIDPERVNATQDVSSGPKCNNFITMIMHVQNVSGKKAIIGHKSVKAWYQNAEGAFVEPAEVKLGVAIQGFRGGLDFHFLDQNLILEGKGEDVKMIVQMRIECEGSSGRTNNDRAKAHKTLPQPLVCKAVIPEEDNDGASHEVIMQQANPPVHYNTGVDYEKSWSAAEMKLFVSADNMEADERIYFAVYKNKDGEMVLRRDGTYWDLGQEDFNRWAYQACAAKSERFELDNFAHQNSSAGNTLQAFALVDLKKKATFGLQLGVTTPTGFSSGAVHVFGK